jgi:DNA ligase 4
MLCIQDNAPLHKVSVEEVDKAPLVTASRCRFSSPNVRAFAQHEFVQGPTGLPSDLYPLLKARDSKWLTRLILKDYTPVVLPEGLIYRLYHPLLPSLLRIQDELAAALHFLANLKSDALMLDGNDFRSHPCGYSENF